MAKVLDSYSALSNLKGKSETKNLERKLSAAEEGTVVDDSTLSSTVQKRTKATTFYDLYTSYLTFRDSEVKKNYKKFKIAQQSAGMFLILHLYLVITQVVGQLEIQGGNVDGLLIVNAVVAILFPFLLGSALAIINYLMISDKNLLSSRSVIILHSVWVIGTTISFALSLIVSEVHHGSCANTASLACKDHDPEHFSETLMIITTLIPFILSLIAKGSEWNVTILSWVIAFTTVLVLLSTYDKNEITSTFLIFLPLSLIFGLEIRRQNLSEYLIFQQLQELLATRERESDEKYALEMRHMIGNVAHDLKTPLAGFVSGVDYAVTVVEEIEICLLEKIKDTKFVTAKSESLTSNLENMKSINSFMLMTINRCIDYTKATKGLQLVPRLETVSVAEAVNLPLSCMKDLQNRISIEIKTISDDITPFIITDKQWLQENILCLLSNAVKYSNEGIVSVSIFLVENDMEEWEEQQNRESISSMSNSSVVQLESKTVSSSSYGVDTHIRPEAKRSSIGKEKWRDAVLRIEVEDFGIGLTEEAMKNLFKPFKQAMRLAGGTGLGLFSLAKRLDALNGKYGVQQRRDGGQGSLFWFSIPYRPDTTQQGKCSAPLYIHADKKQLLNLSVCNQSQKSTNDTVVPIDLMHSAKISSKEMKTDFEENKSKIIKPSVPQRMTIIEDGGSKGSLNILLVDDSLPILKMTTTMLQRQGHSIINAENGAQAFATLVSRLPTDSISTMKALLRPFEVILMDLQMPVMDGLEATRRIRKHEDYINKEIADSKLARKPRGSVAKAMENRNKLLSDTVLLAAAQSATELLEKKNKNEKKYEILHIGGSELDAKSFIRVISRTVLPNGLATLLMNKGVKLTAEFQPLHHFIIGVSACSDYDTIQEAFDAGVDAFVPKPFTLQTFNETISQWKDNNNGVL